MISQSAACNNHNEQLILIRLVKKNFKILVWTWNCFFMKIFQNIIGWISSKITFRLEIVSFEAYRNQLIFKTRTMGKFEFGRILAFLVFLKITFSYLEIFLKNVFWIHNLKILFAQSTYFRQKTSSIYVTFYSSGGFIRYHSITYNYIHFFSILFNQRDSIRFTTVWRHVQTWWYSESGFYTLWYPGAQIPVFEFARISFSDSINGRGYFIFFGFHWSPAPSDQAIFQVIWIHFGSNKRCYSRS